MSSDEQKNDFYKYIFQNKIWNGFFVFNWFDYAIFFVFYGLLGLKIRFIQAIALSISIASNFIIQRNLIFQKVRGLGQLVN